MSPTAPQPIPTAPGGREPISTGAPPGAPPGGQPFQSTLETEWARTAIAEGQQQNPSQEPSPVEGERTSATEALGLPPHGSAPPNRRRSAHLDAPTTPSGGNVAADSAPSAPTPTGSTPLPAAALPGGTPPDATDQSAIAGGNANQGLAESLTTSRSDSATVRGGALASGEEAIPNASAGVAHSDALPSSPTSPVASKLAIAQGGTPTAGAPAEPNNDTPTTSALLAPKGDTPTANTLPAPKDNTPTANTLPAPKDNTPAANAPSSPGGDTTPGSGIAGALLGAPKNASSPGAGAQTRSTPKVSPTGDPLISHRSPTLSTNANAGDLAKTPGASTLSAGTNADGIGGGVGGLETTISPLSGAALDSGPAASPAELGSGAYGVGLQEAIESLHGTIQLAARQGLTQARISLQPEELGEIRINLTQTSQGLLARVSAESPAAAQALAAAHAQLRQSLSSLGINLTRLDIGHHDSAQSGSADPKGNGQGNAARGEGFSDSRAGQPTAIATAADSEVEVEVDSPVADGPATPTTAPSHGTLIDVLA